MIAQAIYEDFETFSAGKEKYGKEYIDGLMSVLSNLIDKIGRNKVNIFIKSKYFGKCVDRSIMEVLFPENFAI